MGVMWPCGAGRGTFYHGQLWCCEAHDNKPAGETMQQEVRYAIILPVARPVCLLHFPARSALHRHAIR